jgi:microcystin-dependent protein
VSDPFIAEVRLMSFGFAPRGWALANGQLLPINQNQALFSLLGTTYGGNGTINFALPNLQGRVPIHAGAGFTLGQSGGEGNHTLSPGEIPAHSHSLTATTAPGVAGVGPAGALPALAPHAAYRSGATQLVPMRSGLVQNTGGNQPHANMQPSLAINFCIALQGIFPSRP